MSKTPRTDAEFQKILSGKTLRLSDFADFARQLEKELNEAKTLIDHKDALIKQIKEALEDNSETIECLVIDTAYRFFDAEETDAKEESLMLAKKALEAARKELGE